MADSDFLTACGFTKCEGESRECELADPFLGKHFLIDGVEYAIVGYRWEMEAGKSPVLSVDLTLIECEEDHDDDDIPK